MSKLIKMKARKTRFRINAEIRIVLRRRKVAKLLNKRYNPDEIVILLEKFAPKIAGIKKKGFLKATRQTILEDIRTIQKERKVWYDRNPEALEKEIDRALSATDGIIREARSSGRLGLVLKAEMWRAKLLGISVERFEGHIKGLPKPVETPSQEELMKRVGALTDRLNKIKKKVEVEKKSEMEEKEKK